MTATDQVASPTYIAPQVLHLTGATYRQLDFWCRAGYLEQPAPGSGNKRIFTSEEVDTVYAVVNLVRAGLTVAKAFEIARQLVADDGYSVQVGHIYQLSITVRDTSEPVAKPEAGVDR